MGEERLIAGVLYRMATGWQEPRIDNNQNRLRARRAYDLQYSPLGMISDLDVL